MRKAIINRSRHKNHYNKWKSRENFLKLENSIKEVKVLPEKAKSFWGRDYDYSYVLEDHKAINNQQGGNVFRNYYNWGEWCFGFGWKELVNIFNDHYINIVENTIGRKPEQLGYPLDPSCDENTVQKIIEEYKNNRLIIKIKENFNSLNTFFLKPITKIKVSEIIKDLYAGK